MLAQRLFVNVLIVEAAGEARLHGNAVDAEGMSLPRPRCHIKHGHLPFNLYPHPLDDLAVPSHDSLAAHCAVEAGGYVL